MSQSIDNTINKCKVCGVTITKNNTVKSHILTEKIFITPLTKTTRRKLMGSGYETQFDPCHEITDNTILCRECDGFLGKYEQERIDLNNLDDETIRFNHGYAILDNFNGNKIKLAYMADILRSSFTNNPIFKNIQLGPYEYEFKKCLYEAKADSFNAFPTMVGKIHFKEGFIAAMIPQKVRINHLNYYRSITPNGWVWLIKVDRRPDKTFEGFSIDSRGNGVLIMDFRTKEFEQKILQETYEIMR